MEKVTKSLFCGGTRKEKLHMTQILHVLYLFFHYLAFLGKL